jgi:predicted O-methyltransferase YrrM
MTKSTGVTVLESQFTPEREDCKNPGHWTAYDTDSTEVQVIEFLGALARMMRVSDALETGSAWGYSTEEIGAALAEIPGARLISFEINPERVKATRDRVKYLSNVEVRRESSIEGMENLVKEGATFGLIFLDSLFDLRPMEWDLAVKLLAPGGVICVHDCGNPNGTKYPKFSKTMHDKAKSSGFVGVPFNTPRGFSLFGRAV